MKTICDNCIYIEATSKYNGKIWCKPIKRSHKAKIECKNYTDKLNLFTKKQ